MSVPISSRLDGSLGVGEEAESQPICREETADSASTSAAIAAVVEAEGSTEASAADQPAYRPRTS